MSDELKQYIESIVEDVILDGASYEEVGRYLERFCVSEGVDYSALTESLESLFEAISVFRKTGSESSRDSVILIGSRFLTEESLRKMLASLQSGDSDEGDGCPDEGDCYGELTAANNRNLLLNNKWFRHFPGVRDELMKYVGMQGFQDSCYSKYLPLLKDLWSLSKAIESTLSDDLLKKSQGYVAYEFAANSFLERIPSHRCEDLTNAQTKGKKLLEIADQLRLEFERSEMRLKASIRNARLDDVSVIVLLVLIALIWWILSRDITLWLRIPGVVCSVFLAGWVFEFIDRRKTKLND